MNLSSALASVGKGLNEVVPWIVDGLKVATSVSDIVDPPVGIILGAVENVMAQIPTGQSITPAQLQALITSVATIHGVTTGATASTTSTPGTLKIVGGSLTISS